MIRMQKKPEVKKEKSVDDSVPGSANSPVNVDVSAAEPKEEEGAGGLSLLGIGGKQIKAGAKKAGKKRTPGEIRIQKGEKTRHMSYVLSPSYSLFLVPFRRYF